MVIQCNPMGQGSTSIDLVDLCLLTTITVKETVEHDVEIMFQQLLVYLSTVSLQLLRKAKIIVMYQTLLITSSSTFDPDACHIGLRCIAILWLQCSNSILDLFHSILSLFVPAKKMEK